jgi:hypothetical protein
MLSCCFWLGQFGLGGCGLSRRTCEPWAHGDQPMPRLASAPKWEGAQQQLLPQQTESVAASAPSLCNGLVCKASMISHTVWCSETLHRLRSGLRSWLRGPSVLAPDQQGKDGPPVPSGPQYSGVHGVCQERDSHLCDTIYFPTLTTAECSMHC